MAVFRWVKDLVWPDGLPSFFGFWFWNIMYVLNLGFALYLLKQ